MPNLTDQSDFSPWIAKMRQVELTDYFGVGVDYGRNKHLPCLV